MKRLMLILTLAFASSAAAQLSEKTCNLACLTLRVEHLEWWVPQLDSAIDQVDDKADAAIALGDEFAARAETLENVVADLLSSLEFAHQRIDELEAQIGSPPDLDQLQRDLTSVYAAMGLPFCRPEITDHVFVTAWGHSIRCDGFSWVEAGWGPGSRSTAQRN